MSLASPLYFWSSSGSGLVPTHKLAGTFIPLPSPSPCQLSFLGLKTAPSWKGSSPWKTDLRRPIPAPRDFCVGLRPRIPCCWSHLSDWISWNARPELATPFGCCILDHPAAWLREGPASLPRLHAPSPCPLNNGDASALPQPPLAAQGHCVAEILAQVLGPSMSCLLIRHTKRGDSPKSHPFKCGWGMGNTAVLSASHSYPRNSSFQKPQWRDSPKVRHLCNTWSNEFHLM